MSAEGGVEPTVVEYARLHGLTINHLKEPLPLPHIVALRNDIPDTLIDDLHLPVIEYPIYVNTNEIVTHDQGATQLISEANGNLDSSGTIESIILPLLDVRQVRKLRLEAPLLRSDPESDLRSFAKWKEPHLGDGNLPMEPLNGELNEGMAWPEEIRALPNIFMEELQVEKLEITKDMLLFLQAKIKDTWTDKDQTAIWETLRTYKKNTALEPVTPPLLPVTPPQTPYIPSSPNCHLPLLSDPSSLLSDDLRAIEESIFEKDSLITPTESNNIDPTDTLSLLQTTDAHDATEFTRYNSNSPVFTRVKAEARKVEVPLMPFKTGPTKSVLFNEYVEEMLLDQSTSEEEPDSFFNDAFIDAAKNANHKLQQEQLQEADSKNRVEIPIMDFSLPTPPWKQMQEMLDVRDLQACQRALVKNVLEVYGHLYTLPGVKKLDSALRWTVFPSKLAQVDLNEKLGEEVELNTTFGFTLEKSIIDSGDMTWKPLGLRILKNDYDDDDLEDGRFEEPQADDVLSLVKKRKVKYDEEQEIPSGVLIKRKFSPHRSLVVDVSTEGHHKVENPIQDRRTKDPEIHDEANGFILARGKLEIDSKKGTNLLFGTTFSVGNAIDNFLELTAFKRQKPVKSAYFSTTAIASVSENAPEKIRKHASAIDQPKLGRRTLPCPLISPPTRASFIVSTSLLKRRSLMRTLKNIFPTAEIIDRDFATQNTTQWLSGSVARSPVVSPLASESDIIISPSTGIILTNMRKVSQKPLPGQKAKIEIQERVEKVGLRYECLIVLVSEGNEEETTNGLQETDCLALAEFSGFCSSLEVTMIVQFVAGGEQTLAKWLAAMMIQYGTQGRDTQLLHDETHWELFLRRAGMNAFAAQAVIAELKAPEGVAPGGGKAGIFGLRGFVEMGHEERIKKFETILGGRKVLDLVGKCIDTKWA